MHVVNPPSGELQGVQVFDPALKRTKVSLSSSCWAGYNLEQGSEQKPSHPVAVGHPQYKIWQHYTTKDFLMFLLNYSLIHSVIQG
jgi:hypothetical protein